MTTPQIAVDHIHWHRTAAPAPVCAALTEDLAADFVVVGGGLTGTRTALGLAQSGASVVLLEAKTIGFGASGRSGGQCNPIWRATPEDLSKRLGDAVAARLVETTIASADALFDDIRAYDIDCDAEQNGWVQTAHCPPAQTSMERLFEGWIAAGASIETLDKAEIERRAGSSAYAFGLFHKTGGHVQPLSLTRGFAKAAQGFGAELFENAPVTAMERKGAKWQITTPGGMVTTPQVILTTNAYSGNIWPKLQETYYPMFSISLATAPLSDNLRKSVLPMGTTISDSRRAIFYGRYDRDKRLVFGCVGSNDSVATLGGIGRLKRGLRTVFPQLEDTAIETSWAGRIAVTPEMMPHLHEPAPGVLAALGFSGRGIAMTSVMARTLVKKALGAGDETLPFPVSPITPAPNRWISAKLMPFAAPAMTLRDRMDGWIHRS